MPSLATQLAAGDGVFRARLVISGWPKIYVDSTSLVGNIADGRQKIDGLDPMTLRVAATADLISAEIEEQGATIEITDDAAGAVTASFAAVPTARCWLTADITAASTTITVTSTDGFASSGTIYLGLETVRYTGKTTTTFTGCTRGAWDSTALAHSTGDGENTVAALVTDKPETLIGRRIRVYLYGSSDSAAGAGTERWRGIVRSAPEYQGGRWSFAAEPVTWFLDQPIGGDLVDGVPLRGIYLPTNGAIDIQVTRLSGANSGDAASSDSAHVLMSGHFETQEDLTTALDAEIAAQTGGWTDLRCQPLGSDGYQFVHTCGATPYFIRLVPGGGATDAMISPVEEIVSGWYTAASPSVPVTTMVANGVYYMDVRAPVPRGVLGDASRGRTRFWDYTDRTWPSDRVYLGGRVVPTTSMSVAVDLGLDDAPPTPAAPVSAVDTSARWAAPNVFSVALGYLAMGATTRLQIFLELATGHVGNLLDQLVTDSPTHVTSGTMPLVVAADISSDWTELEEAIAGGRWGQRRYLAGGTSITLREIVTHELRAVGCYLAPTSTGALSIRRLRPPLRTDPSGGTADTDVVGGALPALSLSPQGHVGEVLYRQGWDQVEGEHVGLTIRVRSLAVPTSTTGTLEVAPRSVPLAGRSDRLPEYSIEQAYLLASATLGLFGRPYRTVTLPEVSIALIDAAQIGSAVVVETPYLPALDGTMGLDQVGLVVGYDWSPYEGKGSLTVLLQELETGGYSPGFLVASQAGAGTSWTLTITLSPHTDEASLATWLQSGDEVRVIERDSTTPTRLSGTCGTVTSTTVAVTFDSTWTPGASEWILSYDTSASVDETTGARGWAQTDFAMIAGSDRRVALGSGDADAQEFAP